MSLEPAIEWVEEVPDRKAGPRSGEFWGPVFAELKASPGKWAIVLREPAVIGKGGNSTRWGSHGMWLRGKGFEARARTEDGERRLYVRWPA